MKVIHHLKDIDRDQASVVSVGVFDGIHLAHQLIVREMVRHAAVRRGRSVIVTFEPHPQEILAKRPDPVKLLTTLDERIALFEMSNVDVLMVLQFTKEFAAQTPQEFVKNFIVDRVGVSEIVVGHDYGFGKDREGDIDLLRELGRKFGFDVTLVPPYSLDGTVVSSTKVRRALMGGNVELAGELLGRSYTIAGIVVRGDGRGKRLGFPTANIKPISEKKLVPRNGAYLISASVSGKAYHGMANIGFRPTFHTAQQLTIEIHLSDFSEDIYSQTVEIMFLRRIRDERGFNSEADLIHQLEEDRTHCAALMSTLLSKKLKT